jgi:hypothetical protein
MVVHFDKKSQLRKTELFDPKGQPVGIMSYGEFFDLGQGRTAPKTVRFESAVLRIDARFQIKDGMWLLKDAELSDRPKGQWRAVSTAKAGPIEVLRIDPPRKKAGQ